MVDTANRIAQYFLAYPQESAREGVRDHIRKFWPPHMRSQLVAFQKCRRGRPASIGGLVR